MDNINLITISSDWKFNHRKSFIREVNDSIGKVVVIESPFSLLVNTLFSFRKRLLPLLKRKFGRNPADAKLDVITPISIFHEKIWRKFFFTLQFDSFLYSFQINRYIKKKFSGKKISLWVFHPIQYYFQRKINKNILIYDFYDNFELDSDGNKNEYNTKFNKLISKDADLIICVSEKTEKIFYHHKEKVIRVFNGFSPEIFLKDLVKKPELLKKYELPIIGFNGPIRDWLDFELLEELLKTRRYILIIIGYIDRSGKDGYTKLRNYNNFVHIEHVPIEEIANYVRFFDVGILPYKVNEFNNSIFPNKLFEYIASNIPVVSTGISELKQYKDYIYYSSSNQEFMENCKLAINSNKTELVRKYTDILGKSTWKHVIQLIKNRILEKLKN